MAEKRNHQLDELRRGNYNEEYVDLIDTSGAVEVPYTESIPVYNDDHAITSVDLVISSEPIRHVIKVWIQSGLLLLTASVQEGRKVEMPIQIYVNCKFIGNINMLTYILEYSSGQGYLLGTPSSSLPSL